MSSRDDFSKETVLLLGQQVAYRCSNPDCTQVTVGPNEDPHRRTMLGVGAHITAAAPGGPRYDASLTSEERSDISNGIWLCSNCATLIDRNESAYSIELLNDWKSKAEARTATALTGTDLSTAAAAHTGSASIVALSERLDEVAAVASDATQRQLREKRDGWRKGNPHDAYTWVQEVRGAPAHWQSLTPEAKAQLMRFEASLELDIHGDIDKATELADEAHAICPTQDETRLRALIAHASTGAEAALAIVASGESVDSLNLQAALYLELGDPEAATEVLRRIPSEETDGAETLRIKALTSLASGNIDAARLEIGRALEAAPEWVSVRMGAAMIDYYSALSPAVIPQVLHPTPTPVPQSYAKQDDASVARLERALRCFDALSLGAHLKDAERDNLDGWRLACRVLHPEHVTEAAQMGVDALARNPLNIPVLLWCAAMDLGVDLSSSVAALEGALKEDETRVAEVVALVACYLALDCADDAVTRLTQAHQLFTAQGHEKAWVHWYVQATLRTGDDAALDAIDLTDDDMASLHLRGMINNYRCSKTGDWTPQLTHLQDSYEKTSDPEFLYALCQTFAQLGDWSSIANDAEALVKEVGTGESLRLAATACHNAGRYQECIALIDRNEALFPGRRLPVGLRRLRTHCHIAMGALPEAVREASIIADEQPTTENLIALITVHANKGDMASAEVVAKKLLKQETLTAEDALRCAYLIQLQNTTLAIHFWRVAVARDLPDEAVGAAVGIGHQLGLDTEMAELMARMGHLGTEGRGGIHCASLDDIRQWMSERQQHIRELSDTYEQGRIPLHFICGQLGQSMHFLFHRCMEANEQSPDPLRQTHVHVRFGGRQIPPDFPDALPSWRIHADVTSILLASHFGFLEQVEQAFHTIRISPHLVPALRDMQTKAAPHQPKHVAASASILRLVDAGRISTSPSVDVETSRVQNVLDPQRASLDVLAENNHGFVVDFHPLTEAGTGRPIQELPQSTRNRFVKCRAVVEALRGGPLSQGEYARVVRSMGNEGTQEPSCIVPELGRPLFFHMNTVHVLANADVLDLVCSEFQVHIEDEYRQELVAETKAADDGSQDANWLGHLIEHINGGIESGVYEVLPACAAPQRTSEESSPDALPVNCLQDLVGFNGGEGDVIWVDDRFMNSFDHRDTTPIISSIEVLRALVGGRCMSVQDYYGVLNRFRAANLRFIHFEAEEISYLLRDATLSDAAVNETRELSVLKRYAAAGILQSEGLRPPDPNISTGNRFGEAGFLFSLGHAVSESLASLWEDVDLDDSVRHARATWILDNLFVNHVSALAHFRRAPDAPDGPYLLATSLALLITRGMQITSRADTFQARKEYLSWVHTNAVVRAVQSDPEVLPAIADIVRKSLLGLLDMADDKDAKIAAALITQSFLSELPGAIHDELGKDASLIERMGITLRETLSIGEFHFDPDEFWYAVSETLNGRECEVQQAEQGGAIRLRRLDAEVTGVEFDHPVSAQPLRLATPTMPILLDSYGEREEVLRRNRSWFDCCDALADERIARICATDSPRRRVDLLQDAQQSGMAHFYKELRKRMGTTGSIDFSTLVPSSLNPLLEHLRLDPKASPELPFSCQSEAAATSILNELNLEEAVSRLVGLPLPLCPSVIAALSEQPSEERRAMIRRALRSWRSPLSLLHMIRLLNEFSSDSPAYGRLSQRLIRDAISNEGRLHFNAYHHVIRWVDAEIGSRQHSANISAAHSLAVSWYHADRLFRLMMELGIDPQWIAATFGGMTSHVPAKLFRERLTRLCDVAGVGHLYMEPFLVQGLAYAFGPDGSDSVTEATSKLLQDLVFPLEGGQRYPSFHLLHDPVQAGNVLSSFLGGDRGDAVGALLGSEAKAAIASDRMHERVRQALQDLEEDPAALNPWGILLATLGMSHAYEDVVPQIQSLLTTCDLLEILRRNLNTGMLALQFTTLQLWHLADDQTCAHMRRQIQAIATHMAKMPTQKIPPAERRGKAPDVCGLLIECALVIAVAGPADDSAREFALILQELWQLWPGIGATYRTVIPRLARELPIAQAREFYDLVLMLRASCD